MIKGSHLKARLPKICIDCNKDYLARQANSKLCDNCRSLKKERIVCKCGCEQLCKKSGSGYYSAACKARGKTYEQIYNKDRSLIRNGFRKGVLNPNYTTKEFQSFKLNTPDDRGRMFRSTLEARFSNFCYKHDIEYEYEVRVRLNDGRIKVVDFVIDNEIYIEITGYAHKKWQKDFDNKFQTLRRTIPNPLIVLTYPNKLQTLKEANNKSRDIFFDSIDNEVGILKKIALFRVINFTNKYILCGTSPKNFHSAMDTAFTTKRLMRNIL